MIRRDYIVRMIEEFIRALARIHAAKKGRRWQEADHAIDEELQRLIGTVAKTVSGLSETELLARLMQGESTHAVHDKTLILTTLLNEAGDAAAEQGQTEESQACYLKGLHLLLHALECDDVSECPEFVPKIEVFVMALRDTPLPVRTHGLLMQHYERTGEFAKAEDALFSMLEADPDNAGIVEFGLTFYARVLAQSD